MSHITRAPYSLFALAVVLALLVIPISVPNAYGTGRENTSSTIIEPVLQDMIAANTDQEKLAIIIQFPDSFDSVQMTETLRNANVKGLDIRTVFDVIPVTSAYASPEAIQDLTHIEGITALSLDRKIIIDTSSDVFELSQVAGTNGYVHPDKTLGVDPLWAQGFNGTGITVAIVDSGADGSHVDFQDKIIGFIDLVGGLTDTDPSDGINAYDDNGHGTACAWLVAGSGAGTDGKYTGLAPGADLLIVKALDSTGVADDSVIAEGIQAAIDFGVDVISLSVGGEWMDNPLIPEPSAQVVRAAIDAGIVVVVAAGNSGPATETITTPGVVEHAITVGASIDSIDSVPFSSRGPVKRTFRDPLGYFTKPDVLAPGYFILSGIIDNPNPNEYPIYNESQFSAKYTLWSGTSASCPQIAGLAAILLDKYPALTPIEVKAFIMAGATDLGIDAMEQGYGLANATKSSELVSSTSGIITIVSPLRYPTLPGTDRVFVIGDDRPPQNVTVISTVNRGYVDLQATGNASDFIVTDEQTFVTVGQTYFSIKLEVPLNLPLSALGRYTGKLEMVDDSTVVASMELNLYVTAYGGRLLVDMGHHSSQDPDDPTYYRYFGNYLREQGMNIETYPTNWQDTISIRPIDTNALATSEVFMIMDTENSYSDSEISAIHAFVEDGGTLLILSEGFDVTNNVPAFAIDSYNKILEPYGIQCEENWIGAGAGGVYGADAGGAVENDTLTEGVRNLFILTGGTLSVDSSVAGAEGLIWTDAARTHALLATASMGKGKVIALSDGSILYDTTIYDAITLGADNLRLLRNIAQNVLSGIPKIYDVQFKYGNIGEPANFTAFIFDENIESVEISLHDSNGQEIAAPVVESLGYKYYVGFTLEQAGFYEIAITATDVDGNVRSYIKTFLVPVPALDDTVLMGVLYGLLAVVGVALAYVAILKFGGNRKRRRIVEREWSPQWEDESGPPSIE
ncbi:MAG: S8 family serine peptidase [Candidatus Thorarchaeota archaeon]